MITIDEKPDLDTKIYQSKKNIRKLQKHYTWSQVTGVKEAIDTLKRQTWDLQHTIDEQAKELQVTKDAKSQGTHC